MLALRVEKRHRAGVLRAEASGSCEVEVIMVLLIRAFRTVPLGIGGEPGKRLKG